MTYGMLSPPTAKTMYERGFTLIELSIVLVIIALLAGGVLVGQNLIKQAEVRAQVTQIEKFNQAANTFRGKYAYLPGDIPDPDASRFGFYPRGTSPGEGDGNGIIADGAYAFQNGVVGFFPFFYEEGMFWRDLSFVNMIDGSFTTATPTAYIISSISGSGVAKYLPPAKIGSGGSVYVWSGGLPAMDWHTSSYGSIAASDSQNYFGLSAITWSAGIVEVPLLTVAQAYAIDKKVDDGLPQSGNIMAVDASIFGWAAGGQISGFPPAEQNSGDYDSVTGGPVTKTSDIGDGMIESPNSCYDGRSTVAGTGTLPEQYSIEVNSGAGLNCWLSFKFQ